jgi:ribosomal protein S1
VKEITKRHILFDFPGCKDEIECKEDFSDCVDNVLMYCREHDNKLLFKVNSKSNGKFTVSVLDAYYQKWITQMNANIRNERPILVHIDYNIKGGYACHTHITTLLELTGREYTHFVFIPGSLIVLNIEHNFDRWIGQDVAIIPQNFSKYFVQKAGGMGETENSLVGSRKRVLELQGMMNLEKIYNNYQLLNKTNSKPEVFAGTVTGIIRSNKKMGVFIELNDMYITGLMPVASAEDLVDYKVGDSIDVCIKEFEVQEGKEPFIYDKNNSSRLLKACCRPVFKRA